MAAIFTNVENKTVNHNKRSMYILYKKFAIDKWMNSGNIIEEEAPEEIQSEAPQVHLDKQSQNEKCLSFE